jgi:DNA-binding MurR/RpiR family transcriptional regulator
MKHLSRKICFVTIVSTDLFQPICFKPSGSNDVPYRHLTQLLDSQFEQLSSELQRAARWVREHPAELGLQSLRQSAAAAGVSPATMSRLPRALGLATFEDMRRPSMQALAQTMGVDLASKPSAPADMGSLGELQHCQAANTASVYQRNTLATFEKAAQLIVQAKEVVFLGLRSSFAIAYHMQYTCDWLRPGTHLASNPGGAWPEKVLGMGSDDVLVVVSQAPYTRGVVFMAEEVAKRGSKIVALTDGELSPLARQADVSLLFNTSSPSFFHSQTGALTVAEALMHGVSEHAQLDSRQRLSSRQDTLQRMGAYWERPRPIEPKVQAGQPKSSNQRRQTIE